MSREEVRERAAIAAMHAMMTTFVDTEKLMSINRAAEEKGQTASQWVAEAAVNYADCLISELYDNG